MLHSGKLTLAKENGLALKMYFLLKMGIFQPAMLVYQRITFLLNKLTKSTSRINLLEEYSINQAGFNWNVHRGIFTLNPEKNDPILKSICFCFNWVGKKPTN